MFSPVQAPRAAVFRAVEDPKAATAELRGRGPSAAAPFSHSLSPQSILRSPWASRTATEHLPPSNRSVTDSSLSSLGSSLNYLPEMCDASCGVGVTLWVFVLR